MVAAAALTLAGLATAGCGGRAAEPAGSVVLSAEGPRASAPARPAPARAGPAPSPGPARLPPSSRCRVLEPRAEDSEETSTLLDACERALPTVAGLWPTWTGTARLIVSPTDLPPGVAAQVQGRARAGEPAVEDRIVVAPGLTDRLSGEGLDVVLRHELTHLAMRSTATMALPRWLSEGLASHAGYAAVEDGRRHRLPELTRLRARVEAGTWPDALAGPAPLEDVEERSETDVAAWLAVEILLAEVGHDRVVEALHGPAGTPDTGDLDDEGRTRQVLASLGVSRSWLEEEWRAELVRRTS